MRKIIYFITIVIAVLFVLIRAVDADTQLFNYVIKSFHSDITINKDTSLTVKETVSVYFPDEKHGIFRIIPIVYSAHGKTNKAGFRLISVEDQYGNDYKVSKTRYKKSVRLQIGDPTKKIDGDVVYVIKYNISDVVLKYKSHDEVYWNITGSEWDTDIIKSSAVVRSNFAEITNVDCFAGMFGGSEKFCDYSNINNVANIYSTTYLGAGKDMSIVVALDKNNSLVFPSLLERFVKLSVDNWGYAVAILPITTIVYLWFKRGRDKKYLSDNIYYQPSDKKTIIKPIFTREFIPTVYSPINGLTPSQVGTIIDEKVNINDIIAEIVELARLGYLKIIKIENNKLFGKSIDYLFVKLDEDVLKLNDYQIYLLDKIFDDKLVKKGVKSLETLLTKNKNKDVGKYLKDDKNETILLSSLKNNFNTYLNVYKSKLYTSLTKNKVFEGRPDTIRGVFIAMYLLLDFVAVLVVTGYSSASGNYFPLIVSIIFTIPGLFFAAEMPRKTALGYSYYRQIKGLKYYIGKGKWRYDMQEKRLFFEEMLPLAISLGIVNKLAKDMKDLGVEPPSYFEGISASALSTDLSKFGSTAAGSLASTPSGNSSWSGGSGFSGGGSSGGGFGGGGGGSW